MQLVKQLRKDFAQLAPDLNANINVNLAIHNLLIVDRTRNGYEAAMRNGHSLDWLRRHLGIRKRSPVPDKEATHQAIAQALQASPGKEFSVHQLWLLVQNRGHRIGYELFRDRISALWNQCSCPNVERRRDPTSSRQTYLYFWDSNPQPRTQTPRQASPRIRARWERIYELLKHGPATVAVLSEALGETRKTIGGDLSAMVEFYSIESCQQTGVSGYVWQVKAEKEGEAA